MSGYNLDWQTRASKIGLNLGFTLVAFGLISSIISLTFSYGAKLIGFNKVIVQMPAWQILAVISVLIFLIITACLFFVEKWLDEKIDDLEDNIGKNALLGLSFSLLILLLATFYFGYSLFISFLYNTFWIV